MIINAETPIEGFLEMSILKHEGITFFTVSFTDRRNPLRFERMLQSRTDVLRVVNDNRNGLKNSVDVWLR
jgi:hypothetical protein